MFVPRSRRGSLQYNRRRLIRGLARTHRSTSRNRCRDRFPYTKLQEDKGHGGGCCCCKRLPLFSVVFTRDASVFAPSNKQGAKEAHTHTHTHRKKATQQRKTCVARNNNEGIPFWLVCHGGNPSVAKTMTTPSFIFPLEKRASHLPFHTAGIGLCEMSGRKKRRLLQFFPHCC